MSYSKEAILLQMILGLILIFALTLITGCDHKSSPKCERFTVEYIDILTQEQIANQASADMAAKCLGTYNIESIKDDSKRIVYTFTCPSLCK